MRRLVPLATGAVIAALGCSSGHPGTAAVPAADATLSAAAPVAPRSTFCNPLDLDYRFTADTPSRRDASDPVITLFNDEYYLFASKSGGYWHSRDMRDWQRVVPEGLPVGDDAPAVLILDGRMYYTADTSMALYTTDDPIAGKWRRSADLASYADPAFLVDDDGRVYLFHDSRGDTAISVVELDPRNYFKAAGTPHELVQASTVGPPLVTKHDGTYYLQYSAAGATGRNQAARVYTSRSPTSGFTPAPYGPFSDTPGGFMAGGGHGATFRDRSGNYWRAVTMTISVLHGFERRLGIFPVGFDSGGVMRTNTYLGGYPQLLPGIAPAPADRNGTGWMLLSAGKAATGSSSLAGHPSTLAFDEDAGTWWSAATGGVGEWLSVDLGRIERVTAVQLNFAEQGAGAPGREEDSYQQYVVESSIDGAHWTLRVDASRETRDRPHRYIQLDTARNARFVRVTNVHAGAGGTFAIRDLRIFGESTAPRPPAVRDVVVARQADHHRVLIRWTRSSGATSYVVRFGIAPDKLYSSEEAGDVDTLTIDGVNDRVAYWFAVDAVGEGGVARGTPR